jgi:hypothetical protein
MIQCRAIFTAEIVEVLQGKTPKVQTEILDRAWRRVDGKVAATLIRTAQDYAQGDADHHSVVWLRHLLDQIDDFKVLMALAAEIPQRTLALRELAGRRPDETLQDVG